MGRRALIELLHLLFGLALTFALFSAAAWAYPIGGGTIMAVGWGTMAAVLAMGVGPLVRASAQDRAATAGDKHGAENG